MGHNNNMYDFCGEISEISPNTLSKVDPFVEKTVKFHQIYEHIACKTHRFGNFWWGIIEKQANSL